MVQPSKASPATLGSDQRCAGAEERIDDVLDWAIREAELFRADVCNLTDPVRRANSSALESLGVAT